MDALRIAGWRTVEVTPVERPGLSTSHVIDVAPEQIVAPEACPKCGAVGMAVHTGHRVFEVVDTPMYGGPIKLRLQQPRFRCEARGTRRRCGRTVLQPLPTEIAAKIGLTTRCVEYVRREQPRRAGEQIAATIGVGGSTIRGLMISYRRPCDEIPLTPRYLGIDEIELRDLAHPTEPFKRRKRAVLTDLEFGQVIALLDDNDIQTVGECVARLAAHGTIRGVAMDFSLAYRRVAREQLSNVPVVIDRFHVENRLHKAMDAVRGRELKALATVRAGFFQTDEVRMLKQMLWSKSLPKNKTSQARFQEYLDHYPATADAYRLKQDFKHIWGERCSSEVAEARFAAWKASIPASITQEFTYFTDFIERHSKPVFAYFDLAISNAQTERLNGVMRATIRSSRRLHLVTLRHKMLDRARMAHRTDFICDECGDRTPEREDKIGPNPHPIDEGPMWLCPTCAEIAVGAIVVRPRRAPSPRRRRSLPGVPQAGLL